MTYLHKIWCYLFGHTDARLFGTNYLTRCSTFICHKCLGTWNEYDSFIEDPKS
jgi:hypothetical protein